MYAATTPALTFGQSGGGADSPIPAMGELRDSWEASVRWRPLHFRRQNLGSL